MNVYAKALRGVIQVQSIVQYFFCWISNQALVYGNLGYTVKMEAIIQMRKVALYYLRKVSSYC